MFANEHEGDDIAGLAAEAWNRRAERTCRYEPSGNLSMWDEDDNETEVPDWSCESCSCSECGYEMANNCEDCGTWFSEETHRPYFKFCPNCGARVVGE